jgi:hypothetical protein
MPAGGAKNVSGGERHLSAVRFNPTARFHNPFANFSGLSADSFAPTASFHAPSANPFGLSAGAFGVAVRSFGASADSFGPSCFANIYTSGSFGLTAEAFGVSADSFGDAAKSFGTMKTPYLLGFQLFLNIFPLSIALILEPRWKSINHYYI